jgi:hypothetical protein
VAGVWQWVCSLESEAKAAAVDTGKAELVDINERKRETERRR